MYFNRPRFRVSNTPWFSSRAVPNSIVWGAVGHVGNGGTQKHIAVTDSKHRTDHDVYGHSMFSRYLQYPKVPSRNLLLLCTALLDYGRPFFPIDCLLLPYLNLRLP